MLCLAASPLPVAAQNTLTDAQINAAVENYILFDSSVPSNDIDNMTADGIVTLSGTAPNLLAKDRATAIAESIRGVRAVVNNIEVKPVVRTDDEVLKDVETALRMDPATNPNPIKSAVSKGVVTLKGTVDSWQQKQLSAAVVKGGQGCQGSQERPRRGLHE